jgi:hypothetical protein
LRLLGVGAVLVNLIALGLKIYRINAGGTPAPPDLSDHSLLVAELRNYAPRFVGLFLVGGGTPRASFKRGMCHYIRCPCHPKKIKKEKAMIEGNVVGEVLIAAATEEVAAAINESVCRFTKR